MGPLRQKKDSLPKYDCIFTPSTCEHITSCGQRDFAEVIKNLDIRGFSWIIQVESQRSSKRESEKDFVVTEESVRVTPHKQDLMGRGHELRNVGS
jgi:hypothetical protein